MGWWTGMGFDAALLREVGVMPKVQGPRTKNQEPTPTPPDPVAWKPTHPGEEPPF